MIDKHFCHLRGRLLRAGVSLIEILVGLLVGSIVGYGIYRMVGSTARQSKTLLAAGLLDQPLAQFVSLMTSDLSKAGSDPTGKALKAYHVDTYGSGKVSFVYGINPKPCSSAGQLLGDIGILSYLAYDANGHGTVALEEGLDLLSASPVLRAAPDDYVVYEYFDGDADGSKDTIRRKNLGDPDATADDSQEAVLKNVLRFDIHYYGFDANGLPTEILALQQRQNNGLAVGFILDTAGQFRSVFLSDVWANPPPLPTTYDSIRETEVTVMVRASTPEQGYRNPQLPDDSLYKSHATAQTTFRVPMSIRK